MYNILDEKERGMEWKTFLNNDFFQEKKGNLKKKSLILKTM